MKKLFFIILLSMVHNFSFAENVKVMTYNIRFDATQDYEIKSGWNERKERLVQFLNYHNPKIIGLQEALIHQIDYIMNNLKHYNYVGNGRDDGKTGGEYSPILYDTTQFKLEENGMFWLSETPNKPSKDWDAALNRIVTYAKFKNKYTNNAFYVFNTHFDHKGAIARAKSAEIITYKISEIAGSYPVILMGDFNCVPESEPYRIIKNKLNDSYITSENKPYGPNGTSSGFEVCSEKELFRIDYVFTSSHIKVINHSILTDSVNKLYHSDHLAVTVDILFINSQE